MSRPALSEEYTDVAPEIGKRSTSSPRRTIYPQHPVVSLTDVRNSTLSVFQLPETSWHSSFEVAEVYQHLPVAQIMPTNQSRRRSVSQSPSPAQSPIPAHDDSTSPTITPTLSPHSPDPSEVQQKTSEIGVLEPAGCFVRRLWDIEVEYQKEVEKQFYRYRRKWGISDMTPFAMLYELRLRHSRPVAPQQSGIISRLYSATEGLVNKATEVLAPLASRLAPDTGRAMAAQKPVWQLTLGREGCAFFVNYDSGATTDHDVNPNPEVVVISSLGAIRRYEAVSGNRKPRMVFDHGILTDLFELLEVPATVPNLYPSLYPVPTHLTISK